MWKANLLTKQDLNQTTRISITLQTKLELSQINHNIFKTSKLIESYFFKEKQISLHKNNSFNIYSQKATQYFQPLTGSIDMYTLEKQQQLKHPNIHIQSSSMAVVVNRNEGLKIPKTQKFPINFLFFIKATTFFFSPYQKKMSNFYLTLKINFSPD